MEGRRDGRGGRKKGGKRNKVSRCENNHLNRHPHTCNQIENKGYPQPLNQTSNETNPIKKIGRV
jgi:hypothetical protein